MDAIVRDLGRIRHMLENDRDCPATVRAAQALEGDLRRFDAAVLAATLRDVLRRDCPHRREVLPVDALCALFERSRRLASSPEQAAQ